MLFCLPFVRGSLCCTLFLNFLVAYIAALLKAGADYGLAHELSKAHNIFQYYILYLTQTAQFASDKVYNIGRYYELCLTRVLNHNLLQLLIKQQYKLPKNSKIKYSTNFHAQKANKKALPK